MTEARPVSSATEIIRHQRQEPGAREEFLDWARPKCTSCYKRSGRKLDRAGRCVDCRFELLRNRGGLCPICSKVDVASEFSQSVQPVRRCLECEQHGYATSCDQEAYLQDVMNSSALHTAQNARIARQRIAEIQHVITAQAEFRSFPRGGVRSNDDPASTPDCIVHADEGAVAVEVSELLVPAAGHAHENALEIAQKTVWGAWQTRDKLAGPWGSTLNIVHWYFNDSLARRIGANPLEEERQKVQERTDAIAGAIFDGAGKILDYLAASQGRLDVPSLDLDSQAYDRWWGSCAGGSERLLVLNLKSVSLAERKPPEPSPGIAYARSLTDAGGCESGAGFNMTLTVEAIQNRIDKKAAAVRKAGSSGFMRWLLLLTAGDRYTAGRQNTGYKPGRHATSTSPQRGARIDCKCFASVYISTTDRQFVVHRRQDATGELQEVRNGADLVPRD